jgi:hypothetical protein
MRTLRILFAKELNATLTSPIGYTVAAVFLLVLGYTFSLTSNTSFTRCMCCRSCWSPC